MDNEANTDGSLDKTIPFSPKKDKEAFRQAARTGKILTHFELKKRLGEGGMGTVYQAIDTTLDRPVAIKFLNHSVIRKSLSMTPNLSKKDRDHAIEVIEARFKREAKSAASISHPNLAQIYEANFDTDDWYIAMELVNGGSLSDLIEKKKELSFGQIVTIFKQTVSGLKYAWDNYKIIHRDIKPSNIMVTTDGIVKIVDLGLAKPVGGKHELSDVTSDNLSLGTPQYMAPEQARGEEVDYKADIFALGATLYELCTGKKAFQGNTPAQVYDAQTKKKYEPIADLRSDTPKMLTRLIESMMDPEPGNRPRDYSELVKSIEALENDSNLSLTTLVGLVTQEVMRLRSLDFKQLFPFEPVLEKRFWTNPLLIILGAAGLIPVYLLKDSPTIGRTAWFLGVGTAVFWGMVFRKYIQPTANFQLALLKTIGVTAVAGAAVCIGLSQINATDSYFIQDFSPSRRLPFWKLFFVTAVVQEFLKLVGVWFLPKFSKKGTLTASDYCMAGVASGLAFSLKAGIVFSIVTWDKLGLSWGSTSTRVLLLLIITPLLHACWAGLSARFIYLARSGTKGIQVIPILVGIMMSSLLHSAWLATAGTHWRLVICALTILMFLAALRQQDELDLDEEF